MRRPKTAVPCKARFPVNATITLTMADKIASVVREKGSAYAVDWSFLYGLGEREMKDFIYRNGLSDAGRPRAA